MSARSRRRLRWIVPTVVVAGVFGVAGVSQVLPANADPVPVLPALTPGQLLDKVRNAQITTLSGDLTLTTNLGLPDLGALGVRGGTLLDLLTGTHTAHVWYDGTDHVRLALDSPQAETDWIRNGNDVWEWDSSSQHVLHATMPADTAHGTKTTHPSTTDEPVVDPATAAQRLLDLIDPTTTVTVRTPGYVAGRPVYELVVAPKSASSTVADGVISVDAATGIPLAVRVDAKGASTPAGQIAFTKVSFDKPAASTFAFTPPPGSTVDEATNPSQLLPLGSLGRNGGPRHAKVRPAGSANSGAPVTKVGLPVTPPATTTGPKATTVGQAWDTVAIITNAGLGRQFQALFSNSPSITVGTHTAHLVSTALVNVLVLDDGRLAIGAVTPAALEAAVSGA
jgi:outer membrane lipoprotein-sorting protein